MDAPSYRWVNQLLSDEEKTRTPVDAPSYWWVNQLLSDEEKTRTLTR